MARINYYSIELEIQSLLKQSDDLKDLMITVEEEPPTNMDLMPWIGIFLERRDPSENQSIAAGTRQRLTIQFVIWCSACHIETVAQAAEARDELMGQVEIALMADNKRTLGGTVESWNLAGGEFDSARAEGGIVMSGSIVLNAEMTVIR